MSFGDRIKFIRGNLSQDEFANLLDTHRNSVSAWERNEGMPQADAIASLHEMLNVNLNWLFTGDGEPYITVKPSD